MIKLYCGGKFSFDCRDKTYREDMMADYRVALLGDPEWLLVRQEYVPLSEDLAYIGPFYFETDGMVDRDIVKTELSMLDKCTHSIFLLESGLCPGTVTELIYAAMGQKELFIFYVTTEEDCETESNLHTPCWYAVRASECLDSHCRLFPCKDKEDAVNKILRLVKSDFRA